MADRDLGALGWRRAAAREIEQLSDLDKRLDYQISELRLAADRLHGLASETAAGPLWRAYDLIQEAAHEVAEARRELKA